MTEEEKLKEKLVVLMQKAAPVGEEVTKEAVERVRQILKDFLKEAFQFRPPLSNFKVELDEDDPKLYHISFSLDQSMLVTE